MPAVGILPLSNPDLLTCTMFVISVSSYANKFASACLTTLFPWVMLIVTISGIFRMEIL